MLLTNVTGVADVPLIVTVAPDVKLVPLIVMVDPLPEQALVGEKLVMVGAAHLGTTSPVLNMVAPAK